MQLALNIPCRYKNGINFTLTIASCPLHRCSVACIVGLKCLGSILYYVERLIVPSSWPGLGHGLLIFKLPILECAIGLGLLMY